LNESLNEALDDQTNLELSALIQGLDDDSDLEGIAELIIKQMEERYDRQIAPERREIVRNGVVDSLKDMMKLQKSIREIQQKPSFKSLFKIPNIIKKQKDILIKLKNKMKH